MVAPYEPYVALARKLCEIVPIAGATKAALFNSGAEAVENAVKIARRATGRPAVLAFDPGFHGRTLLALSLTSKTTPYRDGFGPFAPEVYRFPIPDVLRRPRGQSAAECVERGIADLHRFLKSTVNPATVACAIIEPVLGEGGFIAPPREFLLDLAAHLHASTESCSWPTRSRPDSGAPARCSRPSAAGLEPDLVCLAKSMSNGFPLSAVVGRAELMDATQAGGLGGTFGGNPVACAAALGAIETLETQGLIERARAMGAIVERRFVEWAQRFSFVGEARGVGAMRALEIVTDRDSLEPDKARTDRVLDLAASRGVLLLSAGLHGNVLRTLMPLVMTDAELEEGLGRHRELSGGRMSLRASARRKKTPLPRVVILGGAGAMGRITARDMARMGRGKVQVVVADRDVTAARGLGVETVEVDVTDPKSLGQALDGAFATIASLPYRYNLEAMQGALAAGAHYIDLGGLFHMTRRQLRLQREFERRGIMAILGMGSAPGILNVLAVMCARDLEVVREIHCLVGSSDRTRFRDVPPLGFGYSVDTLLDEFAMPSAVFRKGSFVMVPALDPSERIAVRFPAPVGTIPVDSTLHSEVATLPLPFRRPRHSRGHVPPGLRPRVHGEAGVPGEARTQRHARARSAQCSTEARRSRKGAAPERQRLERLEPYRHQPTPDADRPSRPSAPGRPRGEARALRGAAHRGSRHAEKTRGRGHRRLPRRPRRRLRDRPRHRHRRSALDRGPADDQRGARDPAGRVGARAGRAGRAVRA